MLTKIRNSLDNANMFFIFIIFKICKKNMRIYKHLWFLFKFLYFYALFSIGANTKYLTVYENKGLFIYHTINCLCVVVLSCTMLRVLEIAKIMVEYDKKNKK